MENQIRKDKNKFNDYLKKSNGTVFFYQSHNI